MYWHFRLRIIRRGSDYNIARESLSSLLKMFCASNQIYCFSIGSSESDSISIKGLYPNHAIMKIENSQLILEANHNYEILIQNGNKTVSFSKNPTLEKIQMQPGGKYSINIVSSIDWKIVFPDQTVFLGKIFRAKESLNPPVNGYLDLDYGIVDQIQESAVSLIFKTKNQRTVKVLRPSLIDSQGKIPLRFINAARKFQSFRTSLFLKIYEVVYRRDINLCFIVTPYFEGQTLSNLLASKGNLSLAEAKNIVERIALKLLTLQNYHSCFRNLTPDNILVGPNGDIALTGFFLAKSDVSMTGEMDQMIRAGYTAPEQIHSPASVDIFTDIYSLGAIYFTMLVGEAPIQTDSNLEYTQLLSKASPFLPKDIQKIQPKIPYDTCEIISSMLALDKNYRPTPIKLLQKLNPEKFSNITPSSLRERTTEINVIARNLPEETQAKKTCKKRTLSDSELRKLKKSLEDGEKELSSENFDFIERLSIVSTQEQSNSNPQREMANMAKNILVFLVFIVLCILLFIAFSLWK